MISIWITLALVCAAFLLAFAAAVGRALDRFDQWRDLTREERPCTCHPDDNPPVPCSKRYALTECRQAAELEGPK